MIIISKEKTPANLLTLHALVILLMLVLNPLVVVLETLNVAQIYTDSGNDFLLEKRLAFFSNEIEILNL